MRTTSKYTNNKQNNIRNMYKLKRLNLINEIKRENNYAKDIAIRLSKGKKLTEDELLLLSNQYPELEIIAKKSFNDYKQIKEKIKGCKTKNEINEELSKALIKIKVMFKCGFLTETEMEIKISAIEECKKINKE